MSDFVFLNKCTAINLDIVCSVYFVEHSATVSFSNGYNLTFVGKEKDLLEQTLSLKAYNNRNKL